jgi:hypothetical protein
MLHDEDDLWQIENGKGQAGADDGHRLRRQRKLKKKGSYSAANASKRTYVKRQTKNGKGQAEAGHRSGLRSQSELEKKPNPDSLRRKADCLLNIINDLYPYQQEACVSASALSSAVRQANSLTHLTERRDNLLLEADTLEAIENSLEDAASPQKPGASSQLKETSKKKAGRPRKSVANSPLNETSKKKAARPQKPDASHQLTEPSEEKVSSRKPGASRQLKKPRKKKGSRRKPVARSHLKILNFQRLKPSDVVTRYVRLSP